MVLPFVLALGLAAVLAGSAGAAPTVVSASKQIDTGAPAGLGLDSVACPSLSQCTAVDGRGAEVTFNPASPGTPTPVTIDSGAKLLGVACPSSSQCTAVDSIGAEVTFNPTAPGTPTPVKVDSGGGLFAVACPTSSQCTAVGGTGTPAPVEVTFNPTAPGTAAPFTFTTPGAFLTVVACPTSSQCTAADNSGHLVTFNPASPGSATPAQWSTDAVPMNALVCLSTSECVGTLDFSEFMFNPASPGTPTMTTIDKASETGVVGGLACPSANVCVGTDGNVNTLVFNPASPSMPAPFALSTTSTMKSAVACPSSSQCTEVDLNGDAATFDPGSASSGGGSPTGSHVSVKDHADVIIVGDDAKAKVGASVDAKLSGTRSKSATLTVSASHTFKWNVGKLSTGSYTATFKIGGKLVKTTKIKVA
jgi:hypothetical protein